MDQLNEINIIDFITESGETIPSINLSYQLFGKKLGDAPVILINHALTGNSNITGKKNITRITGVTCIYRKVWKINW